VVQGDKPANDQAAPPINNYIIVDVDGDEFCETGFLAFTREHFAIFADKGKGLIPVLSVPIGRVKAAFIDYEVHDDEVDD
jgi:hypothetical protein